jgi:hypothetical protein
MKKIIFLLTLIAAVLFTAGCSKGSPELGNARWSGSGNNVAKLEAQGLAYDMEAPKAVPRAAKATMATMASEAEYPREEADGGGSPSANFPEAERKLIKRANVSIRVENLAAADDAVTAMLKKYDAYAASTNIEENSRYYSLRVPANYYDIFLAETGGMGRLINRYENTEDVTLRYYDLEGRLATKKELLKTFQAYLGKAKTIEEILSVEARISDLQYDIEGTGIQFRNLANRIDYATIDLSLFGPITSIPNRGLTFGERIKQLFGGFGGFLSAVAMVLIGIVVYGIPILLILGLLFLLFFGRIGLAKKLWKLVKSRQTEN